KREGLLLESSRPPVFRGKRSCAAHRRLLDAPAAHILHAVNDSSGDNCRHYLPSQLAAVERRVSGERARVRSFEGPSLLGVKDREVHKAAAGGRTSAIQTRNSGRCA